MRQPLFSPFLFIVAPIHTSDFDSQRSAAVHRSALSPVPPPPSPHLHLPPPPVALIRQQVSQAPAPEAPARLRLCIQRRAFVVTSPSGPGPKSPRGADSTREGFPAPQMVTLPLSAFRCTLYRLVRRPSSTPPPDIPFHSTMRTAQAFMLISLVTVHGNRPPSQVTVAVGRWWLRLPGGIIQGGARGREGGREGGRKRGVVDLFWLGFAREVLGEYM